MTAMRYWNPLTSVTADMVAKNDYDKIVLLPLYPHYSISTTGSSFNEWERVYKGKSDNLIYINDYYDHPRYIEAINARIDQTLLKFPEDIRPEVQIVFSAHGIPVSMVKSGDPYSKHIQSTVDAVMKARKQFSRTPCMLPK